MHRTSEILIFLQITSLYGPCVTIHKQLVFFFTQVICFVLQSQTWKFYALAQRGCGPAQEPDQKVLGKHTAFYSPVGLMWICILIICCSASFNTEFKARFGYISISGGIRNLFFLWNDPSHWIVFWIEHTSEIYFSVEWSLSLNCFLNWTWRRYLLAASTGFVPAQSGDAVSGARSIFYDVKPLSGVRKT